MEWTFESNICQNGWMKSGQRFPTIADAAREAGDWLAVNADNGLKGSDCEVRLVRA